jgi:hypothetical protein
MIDAEFRSEERFSKLSLAYEGTEEKTKVNSVVEKIIAKHAPMVPETYTCTISNNREVLVIEYHDDNSRESGDIFEEIMKELKIDHCD